MVPAKICLRMTILLNNNKIEANLIRLDFSQCEISRYD